MMNQKMTTRHCRHRRAIGRQVLGWALALTAVLGATGCGGGRSADSMEALTQRLAQQAAAAGDDRARTLAVMASTPPSVSDFFAWAEWKWPGLFPAHPVQADRVIGTETFQIRAYASGIFLAVGTTSRGVYALLPIPGSDLKSLGTIDTFATEIAAGTCSFDPQAPGCNSGGATASPASQTRLSVGYGYVLALRSDGTVLSWGSRMLGGSGTPLAGTAAKVVSGLTGIASVRTTIDQGSGAGYEHSLVMGASGTVQGWGMNGDIGALGLPRGNGSVIVDAPVILSGLGSAVQVEGCGSLLSAALRADGSVWILPTTAPFGGEPGAVTASPVTGLIAVFLGRGLQGFGGSVSPCHMHVIDEQGRVRLIDFSETSSVSGYRITYTLSLLVSLPPVKAVQCSQNRSARHCLALGTDGRVWAWGENGSGQLGDQTTTSRTIPVLVTGLSGVVQIAVNDGASFAIDATGQLHGWGGAGRGRDDEPDAAAERTPKPIPGFNATREVSGGSESACALKFDGTVWCWGVNTEGVFGNGTSGESAMRPQQAVGINLN